MFFCPFWIRFDVFLSVLGSWSASNASGSKFYVFSRDKCLKTSHGDPNQVILPSRGCLGAPQTLPLGCLGPPLAVLWGPFCRLGAPVGSLWGVCWMTCTVCDTVARQKIKLANSRRGATSTCTVCDTVARRKSTKSPSTVNNHKIYVLGINPRIPRHPPDPAATRGSGVSNYGSRPPFHARRWSG